MVVFWEDKAPEDAREAGHRYKAVIACDKGEAFG
jgi:hypothetical protein